LREFEFRLLAELGYGLDFSIDARNGCEIAAHELYECHVQEGFFAAAPSAPAQFLLKGEWLQAIAAGDYADATTRLAAKNLSRRLLRPLLGSRPLNSRQLFAAPKKN
jgi:DNA repair protein RecO (recombination protein O)